MTDYELAQRIHEDISANPKLTKFQAQKKYGVGNIRLTRMEKEGLIPLMYKMTPKEQTRAKKATGWHQRGFVV